MPDGVDPDGGLGQVAGHRRVGHDDGDRGVARDVAVVEPERRGDGPGRQVVVHRHRVAVDGRRVAGGVGPAVEGDPPEHLPGGAVAVQVLVGVHADPVGRRHRAERRPPLGIGPDTRPPPGGRRPRAAIGRLPHRAEAQDVAAQAAGHGEHGRDDRATRPGQVTAAVDPGRVEAQRLLDRGDAALAHPHARRPGVGRQPVDVVERRARRRRRRPGRRRPSATAGRRISRRPIAERPMPESTDRCSKRSSLSGGPGRRAPRLGDAVGRVVAAGRLEQREPDVLVLLEADRDLLADVDLVGLAADDVGREVDASGPRPGPRWRSTYGGSKSGSHWCWLTVNADDRGPARHLGGRPRAAAAHRADRDRRVDERAGSRRSPGCAGARRHPTSRTTRWPG